MPQLHAAEKRRLLEGDIQRQRLREEQQSNDTPEVSRQKRDIKKGQNSARQNMLADINAGAA